MSTEYAVKDLHEYASPGEALAEAIVLATAEMSYPIPGSYYEQGGRRFVSFVLPLDKLFKIIIQPDRLKKGEPKPDPAMMRNRPLDSGHVREIVSYLGKNETYLIPPIIVNSSESLDIFVAKSSLTTRPCTFVLPKEDSLYVTDGQHRVEALRQAVAIKPGLLHDAVGITLIEEMDLERIHQDFYDAAQTKKLEPGLLVEFDGRSIGNALAKEICQTVPLFRDRTERLGTIGKNSLKLFTTNQVKQGCFHLILGEVRGNKAGIIDRVGQQIAPVYEEWVECLKAFFAAMTEHNPQWRTIVERAPETGHVQDPAPEFRKEYLHCVAGGLNVMCAVGHMILAKQETVSADFTDEQRYLLKRLATLGWERDNPLWYGGIVSTSGTVTPHRGNLTLAIAKVKEALGMTLTKGEQSALDKWDAGKPQPVGDDDGELVGVGQDVGASAGIEA
jgi:DNA sulfur modification protein DndB